eukprot:s1141_g23.t1
MLAPVRVNVALLFLKITSAGALGAVFFSSGSPSPDSDPECFPPEGGVEQAVQSFTVGLTTTILGDVIISILFALQMKKVVFSADEWSEKQKKMQHLRWRIWSGVFWLTFLVYGSFCELYICLFLANVSHADASSWLQSMGVSLLESLLLKPSVTALTLASIATLVLCCRPHLTQKIQAKWIKHEPLDAIDECQHPKTPQGTESTGIHESRLEIESDSEEAHADSTIMMDSM